MTLHDAALIFDHWKRMPPLRVLVTVIAKTLGVEFPDPTKPIPEKQYMTAEELKRLVDMTGGKIEGMGGFYG